MQRCAICNKFNIEDFIVIHVRRAYQSQGLTKVIQFGSIRVDYFGPLYYKAYKQSSFCVATNDQQKCASIIWFYIHLQLRELIYLI